MDGHALYIWLSYGVGLTALFFAYLQPVLAHKSIVKGMVQRKRRELKNKRIKVPITTTEVESIK